MASCARSSASLARIRAIACSTSRNSPSAPLCLTIAVMRVSPPITQRKPPRGQNKGSRIIPINNAAAPAVRLPLTLCSLRSASRWWDSHCERVPSSWPILVTACSLSVLSSYRSNLLPSVELLGFVLASICLYRQKTRAAGCHLRPRYRVATGSALRQPVPWVAIFKPGVYHRQGPKSCRVLAWAGQYQRRHDHHAGYEVTRRQVTLGLHRLCRHLALSSATIHAVCHRA